MHGDLVSFPFILSTVPVSVMSDHLTTGQQRHIYMNPTQAGRVWNLADRARRDCAYTNSLLISLDDDGTQRQAKASTLSNWASGSCCCLQQLYFMGLIATMRLDCTLLVLASSWCYSHCRRLNRDVAVFPRKSRHWLARPVCVHMHTANGSGWVNLSHAVRLT